MKIRSSLSRFGWSSGTALALIVLSGACGGGGGTATKRLQDQLGKPCSPGQSAMCDCLDGSVSMQYCDLGGRFAACQCLGPIAGSGGGAGVGNDGFGGSGNGVAGESAAISGSGGNAGLAGVGAAGDGAAAGIGGVAGVGAAGDGAAGGGSAGVGGIDPGGTSPTMLPTAKGACAPLTNGTNNITVNGKSMAWTIWVGSKAATPTGPIVFYWHGTGTNAQEAVTGLSQAAITEITGLGGVVASAQTGSGGTTTGNNVWYTGDADFADQIVACAISQLNIDTRHIHTAGYSAGALQSAWLHASRSGYIASVVAYSGGASGLGGATFQDPSNVAPVIGAHGSASGDFLAGSATSWQTKIKGMGAFVIDCDDMGGHVDLTRLSKLGPSAWKFFKDHPFKVDKPDPYAGGIPAGFPTYCKIY